MSDDLLGMSVRDLVQRMRDRDTRLPFEIGTFVALEVCERVMRGPALVTPDDVRITDDGVVSVYVTPHTAGNAEAARSVAATLAHLLVAAGTGVPPMLLSLVDAGPSGGRWELGRLRDELEATLVPLNRQAARRVLARLVRDAQRAPKRTQSLVAALGTDGLDDDLDALLDGKLPDDEALPTTELPQLDASGNPIVSFSEIAARREERQKKKPRPTAAAAPPTGLDELDLPEIARLSDPLLPPSSPSPAKSSAPPSKPARATPPPDEPARAEPESEPRKPAPKLPDSARPPSLRPPAVEAAPEPSLTPTPTASSPAGDLDLDGFEDIGKKGGRGAKLVMLVVLLVVGGLVALVFARPDVVDTLLGREPPPPPEEPDPAAELAEREAAEAALRARYGTLTVRTEGTRTQILLFVGRGPAVAENLPSGVAHELVAIADGRGASRAVVAADAPWTETDEGPLYELAMQTSDDEVAFNQLDLGETRLDRDAMGSPGALGRIRVVTNPPGARVFLLVGFGTATIQNLPTDEPREILAFDPESDEGIQRGFVGPSDWADGPNGKTATLEL